MVSPMSAALPKPHSPACERNRDPILGVLRPLLSGCQTVLEIGSGTGQHAVHFAAHLPHLRWQCSDRAAHLPGIQAWLDEAALANTPAPLPLDVDDDTGWPEATADAVFTANTLHYMPAASSQRLLARAAQALTPGGLFFAYGPFNIDGRYTSESNADFDVWLRQIDLRFGIRDMAALDEAAAQQGLTRVGQHVMPAHNFCLVWQKG